MREQFYYPKRIKDYQKKQIRKYAKKRLALKDFSGLTNVLLYKMFQDRFNESVIEAWEKHNKQKSETKNREIVYVVGCYEMGICKIGFTKNFNNRLKSLQTGFPYVLEVFGLFEGSTQDEKFLHGKYKEYNTNGEWFKIEGELKKAIDNMQQINYT